MSFDIENGERREIYEFFSGVDQPFYSVTFRLDVTKLRRYTRAHALPFYLSLTYLVTQAMNSVPEFMLTIRDGQPDMLPRREPSFTDLAPGSECFRIVTCPVAGSMEDFCREARRMADAQERFIVTESESDALIFISCLPWADITSLTNERLFDVDRLSGAYYVGRHRDVKVVRRADLDCVNLRAGDEIAIIGEPALRRNIQPIPRGVQRIGVDVADGGDDGVGAAGETAGVYP